MHRKPTVAAAFAGLLLLSSIPATAAAQEIEFCARNDGLFQARIGIDYRLPRRAIPRDYASTGFSMGSKRCFTVPSNAESLRVRMDAEVKPGRWKALCERSFVKAEKAAGLLLVAEGSKLTPSCK